MMIDLPALLAALLHSDTSLAAKGVVSSGGDHWDGRSRLKVGSIFEIYIR